MIAQGGCHTDDSGDIFGTGASMIFLSAAVNVGRKGDTAPHVEKPDAFRTIKLMGGCGEKIDAELMDMDGEVTDGLDGVGMEVGAALVSQFAQLSDGLHGTDFVVGEHDRNEVHPFGEFIFQGLRQDEALRGGWKRNDANAIYLSILAGIEDGVMFEGGGDEGCFFGGKVRGRFDDPIVTFRAAGGEKDLIRIRADGFGD